MYFSSQQYTSSNTKNFSISVKRAKKALKSFSVSRSNTSKISKDTLKEDEFNYVKKNFGNVTNVEALMDLIGEKISEEITFYKSPENKKIFTQLGQILNKLAV